MATFFPLFSSGSTKITDGTNNLIINSDGSQFSFMDNLIRNGTLIIRSDVSTSTGTRTLYTVTAGKTLYLLYAQVNLAMTTGTAYTQSLTLQTDSDGTLRPFLGIQTNVNSATGANLSETFNSIIKIPAGKLVSLTFGGTGTNLQSSYIMGYEI